MEKHSIVYAGSADLSQVLNLVAAHSKGVQGCSGFSDPDATEFTVNDLSPEGEALLRNMGASIREEQLLVTPAEYL